MERSKKLDLQDAYAQTPWCLACNACLAAGAIAEVNDIEGFCDEE